jgi:uncharacterized protein YfeS
MDLYVRTRSYNSYGGTLEFRVIEGLFDQVETTFGSALTEIDFLLCLASRPGTIPRPSLEQMFDEYHNKWLPTLPLRTFRRAKRLVEISAKVDWLYAQDLVPEEKAEFEARRNRYLHDRQIEVCKLLVSELETLKTKFKRSDDFDYPRFMLWARSLPAMIPQQKSEADVLVARLDERRRQRREQMSPWEKLDIDWEEFHPNAKALIPDYRLWSATDDLSPNGNDTGADVLALVQEEKSQLRTTRDEGRTFYRHIWESWGFSWPPSNEPSEAIDYNTHREFVVALAFSYLKVIGQCPAWLRESAIGEIERYQTFLKDRHEGWSHLREALEMHALMHTTLSSTESHER